MNLRKMGNVNFKKLEEKIVQASLVALNEFGEKFPEKKICGFALYSDDGAMTICNSINTTDFFEEGFDENGEYPLDYKFSTAEWEFESEFADKEFSEISRILFERESEDDDEEFEKFRQELFETCCRALVKVKEQNKDNKVFDQNPLFLFAVSDSEIDQLQIETVKKLNDERTFEEFERWMQPFEQE